MLLLRAYTIQSKNKYVTQAKESQIYSSYASYFNKKGAVVTTSMSQH